MDCSDEMASPLIWSRKPDTQQHSQSKLRRPFKAIAYSIFLLIRLATLVIYSGRAVKCCLNTKKVTFLCENSAFVNHDLEVELAWVVLSLINIIFCLRIIITWYDLRGLKHLLRMSVIRPGQWMLTGLILTSITSFCLIITKHDINVEQLIVVCLIELFQSVAITTTVVILNYTNVSKFMKKAGYKRDARILVKMTLIVFFLEFFVLFLVGAMQLSFEVTGLKDTTSTDFQKMFTILRNFSELYFYHKIAAFFWAKIFVDEKDILNNMEIKKTYQLNSVIV